MIRAQARPVRHGALKMSFRCMGVGVIGQVSNVISDESSICLSAGPLANPSVSNTHTLCQQAEI